ncbi:hypothetical protein ACGH2B_26680 [Streptomyces sp. BBFR2]|uniref:hypothetical protein n=1 Tax=Streptomyces sp. BBFR2 TaxID=3372854 RepID=UPI0037D9C939
MNPAAFGLADEFAGPLRSVVQRALRAEGVPAVPYHLRPSPAQRVFTGRRRSGAYPWTSSGVVGRPYRPEDFPATLRVLDDSFTIQKAHLHPGSGPLLDRYADAFEKVWHHREALAALAATPDRTPHRERAAEVADTGCAEAFHAR